MSLFNKKEQTAPAPAPELRVKMVITVDSVGNVGVQGIPADEFMARGLLDKVRAIVDDSFKGDSSLIKRPFL